MRQGFTIEKNADEEIEVSTVAKSMKVRVNAGDKDGDATEIELTLAQAKELRSALDKAITLADNPYTISAGMIDTQSLINNYYRNYHYRDSFARFADFRYV